MLKTGTKTIRWADIDMAKRLSTAPVTRNSLLFLLEAYTLYKNAEFPQSFLSSWITIGSHIRKLWDDLIKEKGSNKEQISKLLNPNYSDVDHILENLNLLDRIPNEEYNLFMKPKRTRNDIVHKGKRIRPQEAEECYKLAFSITYKLCGFKYWSIFLNPRYFLICLKITYIIDLPPKKESSYNVSKTGQ